MSWASARYVYKLHIPNRMECVHFSPRSFCFFSIYRTGYVCSSHKYTLINNVREKEEKKKLFIFLRIWILSARRPCRRATDRKREKEEEKKLVSDIWNTNANGRCELPSKVQLLRGICAWKCCRIGINWRLMPAPHSISDQKLIQKQKEFTEWTAVSHFG